MITREKITRDDLREISDGETKQFKLPTAKACYSGKATAYQLQYLIGCKFKVVADFENSVLTITRNNIQ